MTGSPERESSDQPTAAGKVRRVLADLVILALFFGVMCLFLSKNGFVGNTGIQPYPY